MQTGFKFRLYPTPDQASVLLRWIGCQRFIYNAKVQEDRYFRSFARKSLQHAGQWAPQDQQYNHFVTELTPWLREVPSHLLRNGAYRWKQAYSRFFKKLAGRPCIQRKTGAQSVFITSELFEFIPQPGPETPPGTTPVVNYDLTLGTKKFPVGKVLYKAHRPHRLPASITITVEAGKWYLSFTIDDDVAQPAAKETANWLSGFGHQELLDRAVGLDRGVAVPVMSSTGQAFDLSEVQRKRIAQKQASARRWQRRLSRRVKGSANRRKAAKRIEAARQYERDVRKDFAHQTSHAIVAKPSTLLIVFEALGVKRMTAAPKAKQDAQGRWLPNGARAKAGLNKAILGSAWGSIKEYTSYKALRARAPHIAGVFPLWTHAQRQPDLTSRVCLPKLRPHRQRRCQCKSQYPPARCRAHSCWRILRKESQTCDEREKEKTRGGLLRSNAWGDSGKSQCCMQHCARVEEPGRNPHLKPEGVRWW